MNEAEEYDLKIERLSSLQQQYDHPKKDRVQSIIDHFDPVKKSKQRMD